MPPEISVIVPVYNSGNYISEAIESILNQSFQNFELLLVNDASTDNSKNKILEYKDNRIVLIDNPGNKGVAFSRNEGLKIAVGKYVAFLDADDIALPNRFEVQYNFMEQHPETGACGTYAEYFGERTGIWKYPISHEEIKCRLMWGSSIVISSAMVRRNILVENTILFDEYFPPTEDYKMWVDIGQVSFLQNLPNVLIKYRVHKEQATTARKRIMDEKKTEIILEQLASSGVSIKENDFAVLLKFITFEYHFPVPELNRLFEIYLEFISKNNISMAYEPNIINKQIKERLFEACYHSTDTSGMAAIKLYKKYYGLGGVDIAKKMKFYYKGMVK